MAKIEDVLGAGRRAHHGPPALHRARPKAVGRPGTGAAAQGLADVRRSITDGFATREAAVRRAAGLDDGGASEPPSE